MDTEQSADTNINVSLYSDTAMQEDNSSSDAEPGDTEAAEQPGMPRSLYILSWATGILACAFIASILQMQQDEVNGGYFIIVALYAVVGVAALSDAALRRIPNRFNYTALILALLLNMVIAPALEFLDYQPALQWIGANSSVWGGIAFESLMGFGLCAAVGIISFAMRGLGGGDVKLLAVLGVLAGWSLSISILLNTLGVAVIIGIVNLLLRGRVIRTLQQFLVRFYTLVNQKDFTSPVAFKQTESPFCLSLFIGLVLLPYVNVHAWCINWIAQITG